MLEVGTEPFVAIINTSAAVRSFDAACGRAQVLRCWCLCAVASRNSLPYGGRRNRGRNLDWDRLCSVAVRMDWLPHGSVGVLALLRPHLLLSCNHVDRSVRLTVSAFRAGNVDLLQ